jgi:GTP-dependent phosphoenolpyruvate carboxykinase
MWLTSKEVTKMDDKTKDVLKQRLGDDGLAKLMRINNPRLHQFMAKYIEQCNPEKVFICTDTPGNRRSYHSFR